jgi:hypothetical protein
MEENSGSWDTDFSSLGINKIYIWNKILKARGIKKNHVQNKSQVQNS